MMTIILAVLVGLTGGAYCAEFGDLEVKAPTLKASSRNAPPAPTPVDIASQDPEKEDLCYFTRKGCETVSSFYAVQLWTLKHGGDCAKIAPDINIRIACYLLVEKYPPYLSVREEGKKEICEEIASHPKVMFQRSQKEIEDIKSECIDEFYMPGTIVLYRDQRGRVVSRGGTEALTAGKEKGQAGDSNPYKQYGGKGQNRHDLFIQLACSRRNNVKLDGLMHKYVWMTDSVSLKVARTLNESDATSENFSLDFSFLKLGATHTKGTAETFKKGDFIPLDIKSVFCGSNTDEIARNDNN